MKKLTVALVLAMMMSLAACGSTETASTTETAATETVAEETEAVEETEEEETSEEETTEAEETADVVEVDVNGPYPATTDWDEYAIVDYYFAETDETVDMLVETNTAHDEYTVLFDFFGDKQQMTFTSDLTVEYDLTGFIGKDVEAIYTYIQENVTEWTPIEK